uniref:AP (Apurinic) endonuclease family 2 n=1 Tax=Marseillevirus LCMAC101 TaxID=2506602 RepID=A0A481YSD1_9VIRU|nr:MAG: AP (apurinic) endonuclease family 2 [Marseillevirus LCMAC101]
MAVIEFKDTDYKYGFHVVKQSTLTKTIQRVASITPFTAFQTCIANPRGKNVPEFDVEDVVKAKKLLEETEIYMCVHGSLVYNLAGSVTHRDDPCFSRKCESTCVALTGELDVCAGLGVGVVVHPGSCKKKKEGIVTIGKMIENVLTRNSAASKKLAKGLGISVNEFKKKRKIILENAAGEGNKIASTLEDIRDIIEEVPSNLRPQVKVCIDTAHAYGAGLYQFKNPKEVKRFYKDFDKIVGLKYLEVFHLNDSRRSEKKGNNAFFGSKKDRHENLGLGYIFDDTNEVSDGLKEFFRQAYKRKIPIIGEPPKKTEAGGEGPGGIRDWYYVCDLLKETKYPLVEEIEVDSRK